MELIPPITEPLARVVGYTPKELQQYRPNMTTRLTPEGQLEVIPDIVNLADVKMLVSAQMTNSAGGDLSSVDQRILIEVMTGKVTAARFAFGTWTGNVLENQLGEHILLPDLLYTAMAGVDGLRAQRRLLEKAEDGTGMQHQAYVTAYSRLAGGKPEINTKLALSGEARFLFNISAGITGLIQKLSESTAGA